MPRKKKPVGEMTKEELAKKFFPKKAKKKLDEIAHEQDDKPVRRPCRGARSLAPRSRQQARSRQILR